MRAPAQKLTGASSRTKKTDDHSTYTGVRSVVVCAAWDLGPVAKHPGSTERPKKEMQPAIDKQNYRKASHAGTKKVMVHD